eukprot:scaffold11675_cov123-Cylindrotheca_fusiformis.AAC.6
MLTPKALIVIDAVVVIALAVGLGVDLSKDDDDESKGISCENLDSTSMVPSCPPSIALPTAPSRSSRPLFLRICTISCNSLSIWLLLGLIVTCQNTKPLPRIVVGDNVGFPAANTAKLQEALSTCFLRSKKHHCHRVERGPERFGWYGAKRACHILPISALDVKINALTLDIPPELGFY